jgi:Flp pilus assembly pilin Flp
MTQLEKSLVVPLMRLLSRDGLRRDEGQTLAEYALILALIAAAVVAVVTVFGGKLHDMFDSITTAV